MTLNEIAAACDVISAGYAELTKAQADLEIAQLHNRWYNARLTELLKAITDVNAIEYQHPAVQSAVKNANNLLEGLKNGSD